MAVQMLTYHLEKESGKPLYFSLYTKIRADILSGEIPTGAKMPSRRALAAHLGVSVATVETAYQLLAEEGFIQSRERSGNYVCPVPLQRGIVRYRQLNLLPTPEPVTEMSAANSALCETLYKIMREVMATKRRQLMERSPHQGSVELRNAIAQYLLRYRGIVAQPEQIVIGAGSEYLYGMLVQLLGRDRIYGVESPSYDKIRLVYEASGARCEMLTMGKDGISSSALQSTHASVLHITPYHSFPTGISATMTKRAEYLSWAAKGKRFIVEDDFASEFAPSRKPVETLFAADYRQLVIYLNTFSRSLTPSIRVGYMILPESLTKLYEAKLGFYACAVPLFEQYMLARFIDEGHFERHLNRLRRAARTEEQ